MRRGRLVLLALLASGPARAQSGPQPPPQPTPEQSPIEESPIQEAPIEEEQPTEEPGAEQPTDEPASGQPGDEPAEAPAKRETASDQELAGSLGVDLGGRVSPGGLHVAGAYLYQLSDADWFDGGLSFTFGSGQAGCFRDRADQYLCDHGMLEGFGGELFGGVRRYFAGQGRFTPYARAAVGLRLVSFSADDVTGLAIPLQLGGGVRARVDRRISLSAGAALRAGPAWFNRELDDEPHLGLAVHAGIEFQL